MNAPASNNAGGSNRSSVSDYLDPKGFDHDAPEGDVEAAIIDSDLVEAVLRCRSHKAARDLVTEFRRTGKAHPVRQYRSRARAEQVGRIVAGFSVAYSHAALVELVQDSMGVNEVAALTAVYEAFHLGLIEVRDFDGAARYKAVS